jgi:predicted permease
MGGRAALAGAAKAAALNPVIVGTVIGLALAFTGATLPGPIDAFVKFLGPAAPPTALFALGATLALRPVSRASAEPAGVMTALKLFIQPALAAAFLFSLPEIDPVWLAAGVVYAACPIGLNAYLFARRYEVGVSPVSTAIVISTAISVITLSALLIWFGDRL